MGMAQIPVSGGLPLPSRHFTLLQCLAYSLFILLLFQAIVDPSFGEALTEEELTREISSQTRNDIAAMFNTDPKMLKDDFDGNTLNHPFHPSDDYVPPLPMPNPNNMKFNQPDPRYRPSAQDSAQDPDAFDSNAQAKKPTGPIIYHYQIIPSTSSAAAVRSPSFSPPSTRDPSPNDSGSSSPKQSGNLPAIEMVQETQKQPTPIQSPTDEIPELPSFHATFMSRKSNSAFFFPIRITEKTDDKNAPMKRRSFPSYGIFATNPEHIDYNYNSAPIFMPTNVRPGIRQWIRPATLWSSNPQIPISTPMAVSPIPISTPMAMSPIPISPFPMSPIAIPPASMSPVLMSVSPMQMQPMSVSPMQMPLMSVSPIPVSFPNFQQAPPPIGVVPLPIASNGPMPGNSFPMSAQRPRLDFPEPFPASNFPPVPEGYPFAGILNFPRPFPAPTFPPVSSGLTSASSKPFLFNEGPRPQSPVLTQTSNSRLVYEPPPRLVGRRLVFPHPISFDFNPSSQNIPISRNSDLIQTSPKRFPDILPKPVNPPADGFGKWNKHKNQEDQLLMPPPPRLAKETEFHGPKPQTTNVRPYPSNEQMQPIGNSLPPPNPGFNSQGWPSSFQETQKPKWRRFRPAAYAPNGQRAPPYRTGATETSRGPYYNQQPKLYRQETPNRQGQFFQEAQGRPISSYNYNQAPSKAIQPFPYGPPYNYRQNQNTFATFPQFTSKQLPNNGNTNVGGGSIRLERYGNRFDTGGTVATNNASTNNQPVTNSDFSQFGIAAQNGGGGIQRPTTSTLPPTDSENPKIPDLSNTRGHVPFYSQADVDNHYRRMLGHNETAKDTEFENDAQILQWYLSRAKQVVRDHGGKAEVVPKSAVKKRAIPDYYAQPNSIFNQNAEFAEVYKYGQPIQYNTGVSSSGSNSNVNAGISANFVSTTQEPSIANTNLPQSQYSTGTRGDAEDDEISKFLETIFPKI